MKLHSIYLFRYHIVFYLGNVYNNMALSSTDGNAGDRSVLSLCMSCDITAVHSIERLPMKTALRRHPTENQSSLTPMHNICFLVFLIFIYYIYTHVGMCLLWHTCGGQRPTCGSWFFSFILSVPGTELRSSDSKCPYPMNHLSGPRPSVFQRTKSSLGEEKTKQNKPWLSSGSQLNFCLSRSNHHFLTVLSIKGPLNGTQVPGKSYHRNDA